MATCELEKETYRHIIEDYFRAFGTGDFSNVKFSSDIQFLSPISGNTMKGRRDVVNFLSGLSTRVKAVNIISTAVDFPTASGVWQMTTTKAVQYTLHNFFRLEGEGLAYIWPMFDPKAVMNDPPGLLHWLRGEGDYEVADQTLTREKSMRHATILGSHFCDFECDPRALRPGRFSAFS